MSKIKIALIAAVVLVPIGYWISFEGSTGALIERFPDVDPDIVRKVHKEMFLEALASGSKGPALTDEQCDAIFRNKVRQYQ